MGYLERFAITTVYQCSISAEESLHYLKTLIVSVDGSIAGNFGHTEYSMCKGYF